MWKKHVQLSKSVAVLMHSQLLRDPPYTPQAIHPAPRSLHEPLPANRNSRLGFEDEHAFELVHCPLQTEFGDLQTQSLPDLVKPSIHVKSHEPLLQDGVLWSG